MSSSDAIDFREQSDPIDARNRAVDLAPTVNLLNNEIHFLQRLVRDIRASATAWRTRAMEAERQLREQAEDGSIKSGGDRHAP